MCIGVHQLLLHHRVDLGFSKRVAHKGAKGLELLLGKVGHQQSSFLIILHNLVDGKVGLHSMEPQERIFWNICWYLALVNRYIEGKGGDKGVDDGIGIGLD